MFIEPEILDEDLESPDLILKEINIDSGLKYCVKDNYEKRNKHIKKGANKLYTNYFSND